MRSRDAPPSTSMSSPSDRRSRASFLAGTLPSHWVSVQMDSRCSNRNDEDLLSRSGPRRHRWWWNQGAWQRERCGESGGVLLSVGAVSAPNSPGWFVRGCWIGDSANTVHGSLSPWRCSGWGGRCTPGSARRGGSSPRRPARPCPRPAPGKRLGIAPGRWRPDRIRVEDPHPATAEAPPLAHSLAADSAIPPCDSTTAPCCRRGCARSGPHTVPSRSPQRCAVARKPA